LVTFKGANSITVTFQTKPQWPPGHRELAFLRTFNFHATTGAAISAAIERTHVVHAGPRHGWAVTTLGGVGGAGRVVGRGVCDAETQ